MNGLLPRFALYMCLISAGFANTAGRIPIHLSDVKEGMLLVETEEGGTYAEVPKLDTRVRITVDGMVATATVDQVFTNDNDEPIEAIYVFPLPDQAAVSDMQMLVNDRLIQSEVAERNTAKKKYEQAKKEGKRASLTEQERPNIFTNSVANILPGDTIIVRLQYVDHVDYSSGTFHLRFPMVVGPRFIPGDTIPGFSGSGWSVDTDEVPDASRITPPVMSGGKRSGNKISLSVDLETGLPLASVVSVNHDVNIMHRGEGARFITLNNSDEIPNRDFVLEYKVAQGSEPKAALFSAKKGGDDYFMLMAVPPVELQDQNLPKEMIYVIDISGSMSGESIRQAKSALLKAISSLNAGDMFNIIHFNDQFGRFSPIPVPATKNYKNAAGAFVRNLTASGGTMAQPALRTAMIEVGDPDAVRMIMFLTDGDVGNENAIFNDIQNLLGNSRLFPVGIGSAPNSFLLRKAAKFGKGTFTHISTTSQVEGKMSELLSRIERPVLTNVKLTLGGEADLHPNPIRDLFHGEPMLVFGKAKGLKNESALLTGKTPAGYFRLDLPLDFENAGTDPAIPTLWARRKIGDLMDEYRLGNKEVKDDVIAIALNHKLVTKFTSFVAVENRIVNPSGQLASLAVPTDLPHGWDYDAVFGKSKKVLLKMADSGSHPQGIRTVSHMTLPQGGTSYPLMVLVGFILIGTGWIMKRLFIPRNSA